jgi:hypothetical protein
MKKYLLMLVGVLFVSTFLGNSAQAANTNPDPFVSFTANKTTYNAGEDMVFTITTNTNVLAVDPDYPDYFTKSCGIALLDPLVTVQVPADLVPSNLVAVEYGNLVNKAYSFTIKALSSSTSKTYNAHAVCYTLVSSLGGAGGVALAPLTCPTVITQQQEGSWCRDVSVSVLANSTLDVVNPSLASKSCVVNGNMISMINYAAADNTGVLSVELRSSTGSTIHSSYKSTGTFEIVNYVDFGVTEVLTLVVTDVAGNEFTDTVSCIIPALPLRVKLPTPLYGSTVGTINHSYGLNKASDFEINYNDSYQPGYVFDAILTDSVFVSGTPGGTTTALARFSSTSATGLDISTVTGLTDRSARKSFIHGLTAIAGQPAGTSFTLYVPYDSTKNAVRVCPGAASLAAVTETCSGGMSYKDGESGVSIVTLGLNRYWSVPNMTGTGGMNTDILGASTTPTPPAAPADPAASSPAAAPVLAATGSKSTVTFGLGAVVVALASASVYRAYSRNHYKA